MKGEVRLQRYLDVTCLYEHFWTHLMRLTLLAPLATPGGVTWELTNNETGVIVLSGEF